jgi:hypothetical protein
MDNANKMAKLEAGEQAYLNAIQLNSSLGSLSFDLGVNYYYQAMTVEKDVEVLLEKAVKAVKRAISAGGESNIGNALWVLCVNCR